MPSILVVDDDADTCRNMMDLFADQGYLVDSAEDGDTALRKVGQQRFDLSLLDVRMPGMDGLTLCRHLRQLHPDMVTIIITAYGANSLGKDAHSAGAKHLVAKPVDFPKLLTLVEQALPLSSCAPL